MNMDIKYQGCTAQPNDYLSEDGQLDAAIDLVPRNGALKPFVQPATAGTYTISSNDKLYIHQTAEYTHYLLVVNAGSSSATVTLAWLSSLDSSSYTSVKSISNTTFLSITSIGNTVIMSTSTQLAYFIWRADDSAYVYLGDRVPNPEIQFALKSYLTVKKYDSTVVTSTSDSDADADTTADGAWEDLDSQTFTSSSSSYSTVYFDSSVTLSSGTEYRVYHEMTSGSAVHAIQYKVYGSLSDGTTKLIGKFGYVLGPSKGATDGFGVSDDVTGIYVYISATKGTSWTLTLQQGASEVTGRVADYTEDNYTALMSCVNRFVQENATDKGRFIHPFFVRYAVRLFDGSHSYVSPPALMVPNTNYAPFVLFYFGASQSNVHLAAFISELQYKLTDEIGEEWEDVVDGVDIYVSQPIYPYDQGAEYDENDTLFSYLMYVENSSGTLVNTVEGYDWTQGTVFLSQTDISSIVEDDYGSLVDGHRRRDLFRYLQESYGYFSTQTTDGRWNIVQVAKYDDEEMEKKYKSVSAFYRIKSMTLADMSDEEANDIDDEDFITLELADGVLDSLVAQTALSEDTIALTSVAGANLYAYNNRLHVFNASTKYEEPASPVQLNGYTTPATSSEYKSTGEVYARYSEMWVYLKTAQGERCANAETGDTGYYNPGGFQWYFYPDTRAYKLIVHWRLYYYSDDDELVWTSYYQEIPLKMHDFLNGAYAMVMPSGTGNLLFVSSDGEYGLVAPSDVPDDTLLRASTIYVSEPSNPFAFTATSAVSIGAERVYALATAARALSQGQFGQFPLYAFTSEGVWALETSDTGVYVARQPITRDVCTNTDSITQLDSSVLFVTEKGVMELAGSQSQCISEATDNHNENTVIASLQGIDTLLGLVGLETASMTVQPFREYIQGCGMVYDSANARVFIFNTDYSYTYVIDMKSMQWGFVSTLIKSGTNSYPEALAVLQDGSVVNFSEEEDTDYVACALLTRPVKFGSPDTLKTVRAVIQRGMFPLSIRSTEETPDNPPVRQALYGSRDLLNWHLVGSSRNHIIRGISGSGYKYFRIAAVFYLQPTDCVAGFTAEAFPRQTNTIR